MPHKIKFLKRNICEEKEYHFDILSDCRQSPRHFAEDFSMKRG